MSRNLLDVVVIGAGHAGLSISYLLQQKKINHVILEKGLIGETWRTQRWDSFRMITPNKVNVLPDMEYFFAEKDAFCSASEFVSLLEHYARTKGLPVKENRKVLSVEKKTNEGFVISVIENGVSTEYFSKQLVIASGAQTQKYYPSITKNISSDIYQIHSGEYKNESMLPAGAVLVIGSGQSGVQITEDLLDVGKKVFLSTSKVGRVPRRYRGKDIMDWFILTGHFDKLRYNTSNAELTWVTQPQVSGVGTHGSTISFQQLAKEGAVILGELKNAENNSILLKMNAPDNIRFADKFSADVKVMINEYINSSGLECEAAEIDIADLPDEEAVYATNIEMLNLADNNITSVIWATGFKGNFSFLKLPIFDENNKLKHKNGISEIPGLYFLGIPWLRKRKSGIIWGIKEDAEFLVEKIVPLIKSKL